MLSGSSSSRAPGGTVASAEHSHGDRDREESGYPGGRGSGVGVCRGGWRELSVGTETPRILMGSGYGRDSTHTMQ